MHATLQGPRVAFTQPDEQLRPWLDVQRALKRRQRRSASWPARLAFILVLTTGLAMGGWLSARIDVNLSGVSALADSTGFVRSGGTPHPTVGYMRSLAAND